MTDAFDNFCIVELFGHQKIAGRVTEQVIGGQSFIRIDVPQTKRHAPFTRMFGSGAIYSITPVSEEIAAAAAEQIYIAPVTVYIEPSRQLPISDDSDDGIDNEQDDWE
jgi:hypothetical protein